MCMQIQVMVSWSLLVYLSQGKKGRETNKIFKDRVAKGQFRVSFSGVTSEQGVSCHFLPGKLKPRSVKLLRFLNRHDTVLLMFLHLTLSTLALL